MTVWAIGPRARDLSELAAREPKASVLSLYLRTDSRDPANTGNTAAWLVAARNGLRQVLRETEDKRDREECLAARRLVADVADGLAGLDPQERGRGVAWFRSADDSLDIRFTLQLPPRGDAVVWDRRPFVSPLVDIVDRGQRSGLVLVGNERVRVLSWELGHVEEPEDPLYELELGDWRRQAAYASANPARGQQTVTHADHHQSRVERHRERFLGEAASALAERLSKLRWKRIVVTGEQAPAGHFVKALPPPAAERVAVQLDLNLDGLSPAALAERVEPIMEELWRRSAERLIGLVRSRASAGGAATWGADETLRALVEARVDRLVFDPEHDFTSSSASGAATAFLDGAEASLLGERAVERAMATGAAVTALPPGSPRTLRGSGGIAALLRYPSEASTVERSQATLGR